MKERINDKIEQIEKFTSELSEIIPDEFEEYTNDFKTKAACEHYIEKTILAMVDLVFLVIRYKKLKTPEDEENAFDIITKQNIITPSLSYKLKEAKRMRNVIAHQYGEIDDSKVFHTLKQELLNDAKELIDSVRKIINKEKGDGAGK